MGNICREHSNLELILLQGPQKEGEGFHEYQGPHWKGPILRISSFGMVLPGGAKKTTWNQRLGHKID